MLTLTDWKRAEFSQSACNASGLIHTLSEVISRLWKEPDCTGTDYVNTHPIVRLYVAQLLYLSYGESVDTDKYGEAYNTVKEKIAATEPPAIATNAL